MPLYKTLLPRGLLVADTFDNLTGIQKDIQSDWQGFVDKITNAYEIDKLAEEDLINLMASFSILDLYNSLPPYYQGSLVNADGDFYAPGISPLNRLIFMRTFVREMLRLRKDVGVVEMFDAVMGMLGVAADSYAVLQDFIFHDESEATDGIEERVIYASVPILGLYTPAPCYKRFPEANVTTPTTAYGTGNKLTGADWKSLGFTVGMRVDTSGFANPANNGSNILVTAVSDTSLTLSTADISLVDDYAVATVVDVRTDPTPETHKVYFKSTAGGFVGDQLHPTQTVTVDVLSVIPIGLGDEFMNALKAIVYFLKPTFVVFKDIASAVYLFTDYFYNMSIADRGLFVTPQPGAPNYRFTVFADCSADNATNRILTATGDFINSGFKPGMIVSITGFSDPANNVINAQIRDLGITFLELDINDAVLVSEGPVGSIKLIGDYDHSFQDALVPINGMSVTKTGVFSIVTNTIYRNDAVAGVTGFDVDGFTIGMLLYITGFTNDVNNISEVSQALITDVGNDYMVTTYTGFTTEGAGALTISISQREPYGMADHNLAGRKPFIEERDETIHPVLHEPGPVPTLTSMGSHMARSSSERTGRLDNEHANNLGPMIGGRIEFDTPTGITTSTSTSTSSSSTLSSSSSSVSSSSTTLSSSSSSTSSSITTLSSTSSSSSSTSSSSTTLSSTSSSSSSSSTSSSSTTLSSTSSSSSSTSSSSSSTTTSSSSSSSSSTSSSSSSSSSSSTTTLPPRDETYYPQIILPPGGAPSADLFTPANGESGTITINGEYFYPNWGFIATDSTHLSYAPPARVLEPNDSIAIIEKIYNYSRSGGVVTVTPVSGQPPGINVYASGTMIRIALTDSYSAGINDPLGPNYTIPPYTGSYPTAKLMTSHTIDHANIIAHAVGS